MDIVIDEDRVVRADAAYLTLAAWERQVEAAAGAGRTEAVSTRIVVPPTLIIECVSPGHEAHDHRTKRRWYAEFGIPNYWILDPFKQSLLCLALKDDAYSEDAQGTGNDAVRPSSFPGLTLPLGEICKL